MGAPVNLNRCATFHNRIKRCSLLDLGSIGLRFTWRSLISGEFYHLYERLDRKQRWKLYLEFNFLTTILSFLPLMVWIFPIQTKGHFIFKLCGSPINTLTLIFNLFGMIQLVENLESLKEGVTRRGSMTVEERRRGSLLWIIPNQWKKQKKQSLLLIKKLPM